MDSGILFWNCAHGAIAKFDFISYYIASFKPVLFFVSEAEIKMNRDYKCLEVVGYRLEFSKTLTHGMARSMVYVRNDANFVRLEHLENAQSEVLVLTNGKIRVCGIYRPFKTVGGIPKTKAFEILLENLGNILNCTEDIIIGGDWNVNWDTKSAMTRRLELWAEEYGLCQGVNDTTRHQIVSTTVGTSIQQSCIDLVFQKVPRKVDILHSLGSDHCLLKVDIGVKKPTLLTKKLVTVDWRNYSKDKAVKTLLMCLCGKIFPSSARGLFEWINNVLVETCNKLIPKRVVRLRDECEFENSRIEAMKKRRDRAWKKFKKTGQEKYLQLSKSLTKTLQSVIKKERKRVFRAKMKSHGVKSFWKTVSGVFNNDSVKEDLKIATENGFVSVKEDVAELFATYFNEKILSLVKDTPIHSGTDAPHQAIINTEEKDFTEKDVLKSLHLSKSKKSCGHDEIPMLLVKDGAEVLAPFLADLFNMCMKDSWFPEDWKIAKVIPIYKKGGRNEVKNYRPVSNLCSLSKVFERCVLMRINDLNLEDEAQHGFRANHGTVTAALEIQHHIATALDNRKKVAMYTVDMSAAFDLLRPDILDRKLELLSPRMRRMVSNFLAERRAYVSIGGHNSRVFKIPTGVPQGSVLGPKLFSLYTRGLSTLINGEMSRIVIYADDSYVICEANTREDLKAKMEGVMMDHMSWLRDLGMVVNASKTELIYFDKVEELELECGDHVLKSASTMNVLGILFDRNLNWEPHLGKAISGCQRLKPALRCLKSKLNRKEILQVITSHYYSRLYYGSEVWYHSLSKINRNRISPVHYYPLRLACNNFNKLTSRLTLNNLTSRAPPGELNDYKIAKLMISIISNVDPFTLFHELLSHAVLERRRPNNPHFLDMSRVRIGKQSLANRLGIISRKIKFKWLNINMSANALRSNLKSSFFSYSRPLPDVLI